MAKARRVFEIAKELNVPSKTIIDKCNAEGVPGIINHMSVVKIGLEATIREWFSSSHQTTTAVDGTFTLTNVPAGNNIPVVIQLGRWRRQVVIPHVAACADTAHASTNIQAPTSRLMVILLAGISRLRIVRILSERSSPHASRELRGIPDGPADVLPWNSISLAAMISDYLFRLWGST